MDDETKNCSNDDNKYGYENIEKHNGLSTWIVSIKYPLFGARNFIRTGLDVA